MYNPVYGGYNGGYSYGGYPAQGYYNPPMQDNLAQLRNMQYQQPMQPNTNQSPMPTMQNAQNNNNGIIWVQGEEGAKAYLVAAGNTVVLWDSENTTIYIKSADSSGVPSMRILDWVERTGMPKTPLDSNANVSENYVTRDEWAALSARVDALTSKSEPKTKKSTSKENEE